MLSRPFFTTHEIAELLKVSEATVRSWIHEGELRAVRFGREFRVAAKDLEAFVNAHATQPAPDQKNRSG
ncbi:helix-turn-helix domain-containing protein [Pelagibius sp.]|uniref:helix-turn-helix domain-containing protein n=1 Tax=Pelagibius sp. TaxID=1931238 RepID=UPI00262C3017|nr:helix-turn-helix domain-containing protein [Pelagibius sp.]